MPKYSDIALPEFQTDSKFTQAQDVLFPFGTDILKGDIPDYFAPIGEAGGKEFEDVLGLTTRDITKRGLEAGARTKSRGPRVAAGISRAVADATKRLRFEDFSRSLKGRESLLQTGVGVTEGARRAGLDITGAKNQFALNKARFTMDLATAEEEKKREKERQWKDMISNIISFGGSSLMSAYGGGGSFSSGQSLGSASNGGNYTDGLSVSGGGGSSKKLGVEKVLSFL